MNRFRKLSFVVIGFVVCGGAAGTRRADAIDTNDLKARQQAQIKARILTRELASGVLSIQIRQLRENGLDNLPIYDEIRQMRKNIDGLVEQEMDEVVELLVKAQLAAKQKDKLEHFNQARTKIREVVLSLMAERQKLLKRLQIARIAAQVRELISLETKAHGTTTSLN